MFINRAKKESSKNMTRWDSFKLNICLDYTLIVRCVKNKCFPRGEFWYPPYNPSYDCTNPSHDRTIFNVFSFPECLLTDRERYPAKMWLDEIHLNSIRVNKPRKPPLLENPPPCFRSSDFSDVQIWPESPKFPGRLRRPEKFAILEVSIGEFSLKT